MNKSKYHREIAVISTYFFNIIYLILAEHSCVLPAAQQQRQETPWDEASLRKYKLIFSLFHQAASESPVPFQRLAGNKQTDRHNFYKLLFCSYPTLFHMY